MVETVDDKMIKTKKRSLLLLHGHTITDREGSLPNMANRYHGLKGNEVEQMIEPHSG